MSKRKLKFNQKVKPYEQRSYIEEPSVIEAADGYRRLVFGIYPELKKVDSKRVVETLSIHADDRAHYFYLDKNYPAVEFDEKAGVAEFTSDGIQYKIRALQEDDRSWIVNFRLPEDSENS